MPHRKYPKAPRVTVELTVEAIKDGIQRDSSHCVFAEAVKASFPRAEKVSVDLQTIRFSDLHKGYRYTYLTPRICQVALVNFDQGTLPEPFTFQLRGGHVTVAGAKEKRRLQKLGVSEDTTAAKRKNKGNPAGVMKGRLSRATLVRTSGDEAGAVPRVVWW